MKCTNTALPVLGVIGVVMVAVGTGLVYVFNDMIHKKVEKSVALTNGSESYKAWVSPPADVFLEFRFFNCVNSQEILNSGVKPIVVEKGPYVYREVNEKENISFSANGTRISYTVPKSYVFVPEKSTGTPDDMITYLNFPILTAAYEAQYLSSAEQVVMALLLESFDEYLFETRTVEEILWGYEDPVFKKFRWLDPSKIPKTVGLFTGPTANGTDTGEFSICSGTKDISKVGHIVTWKGNTSVDYWNDDFANMINGTDGTQAGPFINKEEKLYIFSSDVCRSIYGTYSGTVHLKGIELWRYVIPREVLASVKENPDNKAFCTPHCLDTGVLNISSCRQNAPVVMSLPHFLNAAPRYINAITGIHPDPEKHETRLDVEPMTGAVLNAAKRLQFNFYVKAVKSFKGTEKMNDTIFPLLWITETGTLTDDLANGFKSQVYTPLRETESLQYGLITLGLFLVVIVAAIWIVRRIKQNKGNAGLSIQADPLIQPE